MKRLAELFAIRPEEGRLAALLVALMLITSLGTTLGGTGVETLFFARFGVAYLPLIYMIQGLLTLVVTLSISALLGRLPRTLIYLGLPSGMGLILIGERFLTSAIWFFPVMWLLKEVMYALMGLFLWGVASTLCDTRQAKRLFPLFNAGRIFGSVIGGFGTGLLVSWIGAENLLVVWAGALFIAFGLARLLLGRAAASVPKQRPSSRRRSPSFIKEMQQGYQFVRGSALMRWVSVAAVLFSALYFSLALPFSKAATIQFSSEADLAGFLGLFNGLSTAAAFLASLFLANRLFTRFGIMNAILALPIIYLIGFGLLAVLPIFVALVAFKFLQMLWLSGVADSAYQAMFNAVPAERRDQVRAFIGGVPEQAGTFIAGFILVVGEQSLSSQMLYLIGLALAAACTFVIWRSARAYSGALVAALRAGQPQLFIGGNDAFGSFQNDGTAVSVVVDNIANPDPGVRRVAAEILGNLSVPRATEALVTALNDSDDDVRAASLRALARAKASPALLEVSIRLHDPEPEVRLQAIEALRELTSYAHGLTTHIRPLLDDPDSAVRARAAVALLRVGPHPEARDMLRQMAALGEVEERVQAFTALGDWGDSEACELIATELSDAHAPPAVRRAAASALACCDQAHALGPLVEALSADERSVREAVASALGQIGLPALQPTVDALHNPETERGALLALEGLPAAQAANSIRRFIRDRITSALNYHALWNEFAPHDDDYYVCLLVRSLRDKAHRHGFNALRAANLLDGQNPLSVVIENLRSDDPAQRANALETLESVREAQLVRPLLKLWESAEAVRSAPNGFPNTKLAALMQESDAWIRACAALAASKADGSNILPTLNQLAGSDPDSVVRDAAGRALAVLNGDVTVDTLATLSLMERILFLRRVPLFGGLSPADLKQVAAIASEQVFPDGETIAYQGDPGEEMFVIVSGEVRVVRGEGGGTEIARRKGGDVVGEMAIISQEPRMASLVAAGEVRTLCIDRKSFEGLLRERPETSLAVMRVLCARLKEATR